MHQKFEHKISLQDWNLKAQYVYDRLQDEESRKLFNMKTHSLLEPSEDEWIRNILGMYSDWKIHGIVGENPDSVIIYGCGHDGMITYEILKACGIIPKCFCETVKGIAESIKGVPVLSVDETLQDKNNVYVIASEKYKHEMYAYLVMKGVNKQRISVYQYRYPMAQRGCQYFDLFAPKENEVFIDSGAYDGTTTIDFFNWAGKKAKRAYAIEPIEGMYQVIRKKVNQTKTQVIQGAIWSSDDMLHFSDMGTASHASKSGDIGIKGIVIDDIDFEDGPSFIKMDVEGAELEGLKGAKDTIMKYRPRMAICVYHKPNDVVDIGKFILDIVPEYRIWIRHYTALTYETVLYASI